MVQTRLLKLIVTSFKARSRSWQKQRHYGLFGVLPSRRKYDFRVNSIKRDTTPKEIILRPRDSAGASF